MPNFVNFAMTTSPPPRSRAWWEQRYADGSIPWDTGIAPPELRELLESGQLRPPGVALDLGCGTGTNTVFLAQAGFTVFGVDLSWLALSRAHARALAAGVPPRFCQGDVTDLGFLAVQAVFALDVGCLHSIAPDDRARYAHSLAQRMAPDGLYLLYGHYADPSRVDGPIGFEPGEVAARFAPWFDLCWQRPSQERERPVAWYLLQRR